MKVPHVTAPSSATTEYDALNEELRRLRAENARLQDEVAEYRGALEELDTAATQALADSEARLRHLINAMPDIVCFKDGQGRWLVANEFDLDLFQLTGVDYRGKTDAELAPFSPFYREAFLACMESDEVAWAHGGPSRATEVIPRPDGTERAFDVIKVPTFHENGSRKGLVVIGRDITLQREFEVQLRQKARLEAVGQLAGGVAHDFNNVLTAVLGHATLLALDLPPGSEEQSSAETICQAAERASALTRQLLGLARRGLEEVGQVSVHEVVGEVCTLLEHTLGASVRVVAALDPGPLLVSGDASQLHQVITNLALNARDAMDGAGVLTLRTRLCAEPPPWTRLTPGPGGFASIAVEDTGPGIPEALRDRVFEPFFSTKGREGTGMGLAVAQSIVLDHGGAIRAVGRALGGTIFEVVLPLAEGDATAKRTRTRAVSSLETIRVLVVDDDPLARSAEVALLVHLGCEVEACVDGRAALERLAGDLPDLLVLDVDMPGVDGFEVLAWLRQRHPDLPVLLVTGLGGAEVAERALGLGAKRVLCKPLGLAELRRAVQAAVTGSDAVSS